MVPNAFHRRIADDETSEMIAKIRSEPQEYLNMMLVAGKLEKDSVTLSDYLKRLMAVHNVKVNQLIIGAVLSKSFVYQILSGNRVPSRDILLRLAFLLRLSYDETQRLLLASGKSPLYPMIRRDAAVICCVELKMSLADADEALTALGEEGLF